MSISPAPAATAAADSAAFTRAVCAPDGKPATAHTAIPGASAPAGSGSRDGETHTAATPRPFASSHSVATSAAVAAGASSV